MPKSSASLVALLLSAILLAACSLTPGVSGREVQIEGGSYQAVNVQELLTMLGNKDFFMVNVHTPWQGDITQTDLQLPFDQIEQNLEQLPGDKEKKILVYCFSDGMAKIAVKSLIGLGYTNIWMLEGGTVAWEVAGQTLEK